MPKVKSKKQPVKKPVRKRARTTKGRFIADDPSTPDINEAYVQDKKSKTRTDLLADYAIFIIILCSFIGLIIYSSI